jgi:small conductance mechanosensitive channel
MIVEPTNVRHIWQNWRSDAAEFLRYVVPKIVFIVFVAMVLIQLLKAATKRLVAFTHADTLPSGVRHQQLRTLASVINSVGVFVIVFIAAMQILPLLGINMGPLLASAGIAGLAIGFGAQTLVKDVINGFFILMENQYDLGDVVRIGGVTGTVEAMTLRRTVLRDADGTVHVIPNSEIKIVSNLTRDWAQVTMHVAVAYNENSERIVELLKEIGQEMRNDPAFADDIVADPEVPGIERVVAGEVDYLMQVKTRPGRQHAVSRELRRRIKESFEKNHIQPGGQRPYYVLDEPPGR